jgi:hypothetical protein
MSQGSRFSFLVVTIMKLLYIGNLLHERSQAVTVTVTVTVMVAVTVTVTVTVL